MEVVDPGDPHSSLDLAEALGGGVCPATHQYSWMGHTASDCLRVKPLLSRAQVPNRDSRGVETSLPASRCCQSLCHLLQFQSSLSRWKGLWAH